MIVFFLLCIVLQVYANKCGYDACTKSDPNALNVHIVAHSHDDVGWLKTVDQYYYGDDTEIPHGGVQYILDSVVNALQENTDRKFIQVESSFLWKWWNQQTESKKQQYRDLVDNGRIEMVGGAWSMNDEATVNYQSVIDHFTFGLDFLKTTFGNCSGPNIGWQIDPFGHTREMASIFAQMGYDALFIGRLDWRDKEERLKTKTAEMLWKGSSNLGNSSLLFTHALYHHYSPPPGFYFDVLSRDDALIANEKSPKYNLKKKIEYFSTFVKNQSQHYVTNNIIIAMGNDFAYQDAHYSFKNLDILIKAYRDNIQTDELGRRIKLFYSTPGCYIKAVNEYAAKNDIDFKVKTDDFIPYALDSHSYWSGYFTSRPTQKRFERQANNLLQVAKQLTAATNTSHVQNNLHELKSAVGIMQHHDAITGTEQEHVANDYARIVMEAMDHTHTNINTALPKLLAKNGENSDLHFSSCLLSNITSCKESQSNRFVVSVYNPLSRNVSYYVKLPVDYNNFKITGPKGKEIEWQLLPTIANFNYVHNIKPSKYELVFRAASILPLGIQVFYVEHLPSNTTFTGINPDTSANKFRIGEGKSQQLQFNEKTGFLRSVSLSSGLSVQVNQSLMYYLGAQGNNWGSENRSSGAYTFRPSPQHPVALNFTTSLIDRTATYKGKLVDEFHPTYNKWLKQIVRVYKDESFVEFDWLVGPIDHSDSKSKEVISRFETNVKTDYFFTDSNGREILTRRNNHRGTYNYSKEEEVAGNYYPITSSGISLRDELKSVEAAVLTDRAQGGASLNLGEMELMVHRSLLRDDAFGVGEALRETEFGQGLVVRGQHFFILSGTNINSVHGNTRLKHREVAQRKLLSPWVFVADANSEKHSLEKLKKSINFEYFGLKRNLPDDIQILTMEPWNMNKVLLRFENILEISEGGRVTKISLKALFKEFEISHLEEYTLATNQKLNENQRLQWKVGDCLAGLDCASTDNYENLIRKDDSRALDNLEVELGPMQIRTFLATIKYVN